MDIPKYTGSVHPEQYIKEMRAYCNFKHITDEREIVKLSKTMVDSTIVIPSEIESCEDLIKALKGHITFPIFKNSCKRKLHLLKYRSEREGGDTPKFIANFLSLCRDAEIDDVDIQKNTLYYTLPNDFFRNEFIRKYDDIKSIMDLLILFENTLNEYSKFILNGAVVALKHVGTGKYLSSNDKTYVTGSKDQVAFCGQFLRDSHATWTIKCLDNRDMLPYGCTIYLQHEKTKKFLEICSDRHNKSPASNNTEVGCGSDNNYSDYTWILEQGKSEKKDSNLKSRDTIILRNTYSDYITNQQRNEVLGSHEITFALEGESFQEVFVHGGEPNENDEWIIELIE